MTFNTEDSFTPYSSTRAELFDPGTCVLLRVATISGCVCGVQPLTWSAPKRTPLPMSFKRKPTSWTPG